MKKILIEGNYNSYEMSLYGLINRGSAKLSAEQKQSVKDWLSQDSNMWLMHATSVVVAINNDDTKRLEKAIEAYENANRVKDLFEIFIDFNPEDLSYPVLKIEWSDEDQWIVAPNNRLLNKKPKICTTILEWLARNYQEIVSYDLTWIRQLNRNYDLSSVSQDKSDRFDNHIDEEYDIYNPRNEEYEMSLDRKNSRYGYQTDWLAKMITRSLKQEVITTALLHEAFHAEKFTIDEQMAWLAEVNPQWFTAMKAMSSIDQILAPAGFWKIEGRAFWLRLEKSLRRLYNGLSYEGQSMYALVKEAARIAEGPMWTAIEMRTGHMCQDGMPYFDKEYKWGTYLEYQRKRLLQSMENPQIYGEVRKGERVGETYLDQVRMRKALAKHTMFGCGKKVNSSGYRFVYDDENHEYSGSFEFELPDRLDRDKFNLMNTIFDKWAQLQLGDENLDAARADAAEIKKLACERAIEAATVYGDVNFIDALLYGNDEEEEAFESHLVRFHMSENL